MIIREAQPGDAPVLESLYRELVRDPHLCVSEAHLADIAQSSSSFLLVAECEQQVCGTAHLNLCADAMYRQQPFGVVENVVIAATHRGMGIGRLLMAQVEALATKHDCTKLMLLSSRARTEAHAFFRRCGFSDETKQGFVKYRREFRVGDNQQS